MVDSAQRVVKKKYDGLSTQLLCDIGFGIGFKYNIGES